MQQPFKLSAIQQNSCYTKSYSRFRIFCVFYRVPAHRFLFTKKNDDSLILRLASRKSASATDASAAMTFAPKFHAPSVSSRPTSILRTTSAGTPLPPGETIQPGASASELTVIPGQPFIHLSKSTTPMTINNSLSNPDAPSSSTSPEVPTVPLPANYSSSDYIIIGSIPNREQGNPGIERFNYSSNEYIIKGSIENLEQGNLSTESLNYSSNESIIRGLIANREQGNLGTESFNYSSNEYIIRGSIPHREQGKTNTERFNYSSSDYVIKG